MDNVIIYDKLEELNEGIEYNGGGITSLLGKGCVKSVQRGTTKYTSSGTKTIPISAVNMNKSMLASEIYGRNSSNGYAEATITLTNSTTIQLNLTGSNWDNQAAAGVSWQVVEFY